MKRFISLLLAAVTAISGFTACAPKPKYEKYSTFIFDVFDTVVSVVSYQQSQEDFDRMVGQAKSRFEQLNKLYDIYNTYDGINNIKTINDNAGIAPVKVDKEIIDLIEFSKQRYDMSGGKVNIAMGSVLKVWHDVRDEMSEEGDCTLPSLDLLREKARHTDINSVVVDKENMTVYISDPLVRLDVGAVAKGFATEIICDELNEKYDNYAISAGGNVKTHGSPKDGRKRWSIGVQNPMVDEDYNMIRGNMDTAYFNTDMSLVCSGGYQRFFVKDGRRYHHIIDPVTLYPEEVYRGVSIICEDSGMADALSTAVFICDVQTAMDMIEGIDGAECILMEIDGTTHYSSGAKRFLASGNIDENTP